MAGVLIDRTEQLSRLSSKVQNHAAKYGDHCTCKGLQGEGMR